MNNLHLAGAPGVLGEQGHLDDAGLYRRRH